MTHQFAHSTAVIGDNEIKELLDVSLSVEGEETIALLKVSLGQGKVYADGIVGLHIAASIPRFLSVPMQRVLEIEAAKAEKERAAPAVTDATTQEIIDNKTKKGKGAAVASDGAA